MERLTEHHVDGKGAYMVCSGACIDDDFDCNDCTKLEDIIERLAAYEDTGLEPQEITAMNKAFMGYELAKITEFDGIPLQRLQELAQADKDGRLVIAHLNNPLTLEELRKIGLLEWLWIELFHPSFRQRFRNITSSYYQIFEDYTDGEALCCGWPGIIHEFEYEDYGNTWLAYRRKPEEPSR